MHLYTLRNLAFVVPLASLLAQAPSIQVNTIYQCAPGKTFKVLSCAGPANTDQCDVQLYTNGQADQRTPAPRQQVIALLSACHVQSAAEAKGGATTTPAAAQPGVGGFKIGDTVQVNTGFGWMDAKILQVNGANYYVHTQNGIDVWKTYPAELKRNGPLTAEDHANGLYDLHDRVQVLFEGKWVDSEITATMGMEYQVTLPGNRTAWANPQQLRFVSVAPPKAVTKAGVPPKPGFTSCAGKIEGRYAMSNGGPGLRITFQGAKASIDSPIGAEERECWTNGRQIILRLVGDVLNGGQDITFDLNKDGTLDSAEFGELKKKN